MLRSKLRPTVIIMGLMLCGLTGGLMYGLFTWLFGFGLGADNAFWSGAVVGALAALFLTVIGVSIGALASVMSTVAQPDPSPSVPETTVVKMLEAMKK